MQLRLAWLEALLTDNSRFLALLIPIKYALDLFLKKWNKILILENF